MRRSLSLALLTLGASGPYLDAQRCPENPAARFRPSLREELRLAGAYRGPFEFICGAPAVLRVEQSGRQIRGVVEADAGCPQAGRTRWTGTLSPAMAAFPARVAQGGSWTTGAGRIADRCTIEITAGRRTAAYYRTDGDCADPAPVVAFIGGLGDPLNRNVHRVFCAYDAEFERTRKLYFTHLDDVAEIRRAVLERAGEGDRRAPVVLVGHSLGADAAHRVADAMAEDGMVHLLVTLDPVSSRWQREAAPRPAGVRRWINVRVSSGVGLSSCGLAGALGGAWGPQTAADADLRFPPDPAKDDPDDDHCKTEQMFLLEPVQSALTAVR